MSVFNRARNAWKRFEEWADSPDSDDDDNNDDDDGRPEREVEAVSPAPKKLDEVTPEANSESGESQMEAPRFCYTNTNKALASAHAYTYTTLPANIERPIRLLTLLPGPSDADIQCLLEHADLDCLGRDEDASFEALSYVWGDVASTTPIQLDGAIGDIGQNLRSALLHLRREDRPRTLWVDAVCINQGDMDERNSQIALMGDIYTKATRVVVWLGCPCCLLGTAGRDDLSSYQRAELKKKVFRVGQLFDAVRLLAYEAAVVAAEGRQVVPEMGDQYEEGTSYQLISKLDPRWELIFLDNPWWARAWTLQEIVLGHDAVMCMGREEVTWDCLRRATAHYTALGFGTFSESYFGNKITSRLEPMQMIISIKEAREAGAEVVRGPVGDELLYYLASSHWRDSKMPHDKIYAVLGLLDKTRHVGIEADYRADPARVYRQATRALLERCGNLDVLGFCYPFKTGRVADLPSWVPDWGSNCNLAAPLMNDAKGKLRPTHASRGLQSDPRWTDDDKTLILQGHVVDSVAKAGSVKPAVFTDDYHEGTGDWLLKDPAMLAAAESFPQTWDDLDPERPIRHLLSEYWKNIKAAGPYVKKLLSVLTEVVSHQECYIEWQDLIASELGGHNHSSPYSERDPDAIFRDVLTTSTPYPSGPAETQRRFDEWCQYLSSIRRLKSAKLDRLSPAVFKALGFTAGLSRLMAENEGDDTFSNYTLHTVRRRLGFTVSGRVCLLPKRAEVGDQIALLRGGRVPVVLRPREFVGEAYVHGIMDGEAFDEGRCVEIRIT
ncbi:HET-domain-containing protein [Parathielavia hyrcaniae]|uniref:HET-domain-containing protein n=1 Tax=Parathielavia hyrcaniae TaxID=113614 RepID=A0AAN6Q1G2_9PEZI|nr:HET-domain-containing protein [Parathielavia hyrcaniae]